MALPPGHYRLKLVVEALADQAPMLLVAPDAPGAASRVEPFRPAPDGWEASLVVRPGERAVNLLLRGGGPLLLRGLVLEAQPPAEAPV